MKNFLVKHFGKLLRLTVFLFLEVLIFFIMVRRFGGITLPSFNAALIMILSLSLINAILWPLLGRISLRFLVFTLGFGTFLIDGIILDMISIFIDGVSIEGISLFSIPLLIGLINSALSMLMGLDNASYYRSILKQEIEPKDENIIKKEAFLFVEIDGLSYKVLQDALDRNIMPNLKKLITDGTHRLTSWQTDLSSQTSSSQAGILHGNNSNIPAFRWVEKENNNRIVSSNSMGDANRIEAEISDGKGLLSCNGASRSNLFSGDAEDYMLTYSKFGTLSDFYTRTWYYLYVSPFVITKIILLFLWDMLMEFFSRIYHFIYNITPRLKKGLSYYVARGGANVVMREATTLALIGDVYAGKYNVIYSTYMGYDEIAHHSGIRDRDAFRALKQIDKQIQRLVGVIDDAKRHYNLIVLSDHGQSQGPTFKQKYGITLNQLVENNLPEDTTIQSILHSNDDHFMEEFSINSRVNKLQEKYNLRQVSEDEKAETIILASGNLGLIYFTDWSKRLTYEIINEIFPNLIDNMVNHEGIGFVMVKSEVDGTMVITRDKTYFLDKKEYDVDEFLKTYGVNVLGHLKRTDSFDHVPDILVNSTYDVENDEVYSFEELIGSHGGVGGSQQEPFILYPSSWQLNGEIIGAENVNKFFRKEIVKRMKK